MHLRHRTWSSRNRTRQAECLHVKCRLAPKNWRGTKRQRNGSQRDAASPRDHAQHLPAPECASPSRSLVGCIPYNLAPALWQIQVLFSPRAWTTLVSGLYTKLAEWQ